MSPSDAKAQAILDEHVALKESIGQHNLRSALAASQNRERKWKVAFWLVFAALVAVCVARGRM